MIQSYKHNTESSYKTKSSIDSVTENADLDDIATKLAIGGIGTFMFSPFITIPIEAASASINGYEFGEHFRDIGVPIAISGICGFMSSIPFYIKSD